MGTELARRACRENRHTDFGDFFEWLAAEIEDDRRTPANDSRLPGFDFGALVERAETQLAELERQRLRAAPLALRDA